MPCCTGVPLSGHPERHGQPPDGFPRLLPPLPPPLRGARPRRHRLSAVRIHPRHRGSVQYFLRDQQNIFGCVYKYFPVSAHSPAMLGGAVAGGGSAVAAWVLTGALFSYVKVTF